jgi:hypothetical protein
MSQNVALFDTTITLGNVLTLLSVLVGFIGLWMSAIRRLDRLETRMEILWKHFSRHFGIPLKDDL